jgi:phospholipase D1/2
MAAVPLLRPGQNCQRVARAGRAALLIDADAYFSAFARAALRARHSIVIVGWDFHSGTRLHLGKRHIPDVLGDFLNFLVQRRRTLKVYILTWEYPLVFAWGRESAPVYKLGWHPHRRVNFRYDDRCPVGAALHQKIVTIDGAMGFCGGIDLTRSRWDTSEHRARDPRRCDPGESVPYPPFHDLMLAVDADAARALHDLASERWANATGRSLPPPDAAADPWPLELPPTFTQVDVGVARTLPPFDGQPSVAEIRTLYLDLIAAARRYIYIENQYFTAEELGDALAGRLMEPNGPEVIVVLRHLVCGWVEAPAMRTMRTVLLRKLRAADRYGRFRAYYPCMPGLPPDQCCDLHSKLMIVDDEWLRVGSANFANRSMGFDTECDLLIEARGERRTERAIASSRNRLLAEHLELPEGAVREAIESHVSLVAAIDSLGSAGRQERRRRLEPFWDLPEPSPALVAVATVVDPGLPVPLEIEPAESSIPIPSLAGESRLPIPASVGVAALAAGLTLLWHSGVSAPLTDALRAAELARSVAGNAWIVPLILVAYTPAALVLFPRPLITLFAVVALGPRLGFVCSFAGVMLSAAVTYLLGCRLNRSFVRRLAGRRLGRVSRFLYHRGAAAMAAVRLVPLAPFAVVNLVAAAMGVRPWRFLVGTALGLLPGTLVATLFGEELAQWLRDPHSINIALCAAAVAALVTSGWAVHRWFATSRERPGYVPGGEHDASRASRFAGHSSARQTGRTNDRVAAAAD